MIKRSCVYKGLINPVQISPAGESSNDERRKIPMEEFMREYGSAVKISAVLLGLTVLILFLCRTDEGSFLLEQFKTVFTNFFTKMNALS